MQKSVNVLKSPYALTILQKTSFFKSVLPAFLSQDVLTYSPLKFHEIEIVISLKKEEWFSNIRTDVLAGLVVGLALIPESIAFSAIAGVDPQVGLYASFCKCLGDFNFCGATA